MNTNLKKLLTNRMPYLFNVNDFVDRTLEAVDTNRIQAATPEDIKLWLRGLIAQAASEMARTYAQASEKAFSEAARIMYDPKYQKSRSRRRSSGQARLEAGQAKHDAERRARLNRAELIKDGRVVLMPHKSLQCNIKKPLV